MRQDQLTLTKKDSYEFVSRVAREYAWTHAKAYPDGRDRMHLHRETVIESSIATVMTQILPKTARPYQESIPEFMSAIQPMVELTLELSGPKAAESTASKAWIAQKISDGDITYSDCDDHEELMDHVVSQKIAEACRNGSKSGALVLRAGEKSVGPDKMYTLSLTRVARRRATVASLTLKYLRAGGVAYAIQQMRDLNEFPVRIHASPDNTLETDWNNFSEILWKFAIHYLASEGLTETSEESRAILVYIFHGEYVFSRRKIKKAVKMTIQVNKPIIHALHFNLTANRSRFVQHVEEHFHEFFKVLDDHPEYEKYLDDRGKAVVPRLLLIAVERGVRA